jgi:F-type H+-transporting ATPase subunit b
MPQLEFASYAAQIFWLAIVFIALYIYLSKGPLPVIREVLHNRQSRISGDLKKAESLKREAEAAAHDFTEVIAKARHTAHKVLGDAKARIDSQESSRNAKVEQNFAHQNKEAENRIIILRKEATAKLIPVAASVAASMAEKLIGTKMDENRAAEIALEISKEITAG